MRVDWSLPAVGDLQAIRDYIARDSEHYAARFIAQFLTAVEILETSPELGQVVSELGDDSIRQIIRRQYCIIYRTEPRRVLILAVVHGSREFAALDPTRWKDR